MTLTARLAGNCGTVRFHFFWNPEFCAGFQTGLEKSVSMQTIDRIDQTGMGSSIERPCRVDLQVQRGKSTAILLSEHPA